MQDQDVNVSEIVLTDEHTKIKYSFDERREGITKTCYANVKFDFKPSDDLRNAIKNLRPHVAVLLNYQNEEEIFDLAQVADNSAIVPTGIKFFQKPESDSVQITGFIYSKNKQVRFTTQKIDLMDSQYKFLPELSETTDEILDEAAAYVNGKFSVAATQLSLTDSPDVEELQAAA